VAYVIDVGEVNEHDLRAVFVDDLNGVFGDDAVGHVFFLGFFSVVGPFIFGLGGVGCGLGGGRSGGDPVPIDRAGAIEDFEFGFAGGHGCGVAVTFGDIEQRAALGIDGLGKREIGIPFDLVAVGGYACEHGDVRRKRDGGGSGFGPEGEAAGAD